MFQHKINEKNTCIRLYGGSKELSLLRLHQNIGWQCSLLKENYIQILNVILVWKASLEIKDL